MNNPVIIDEQILKLNPWLSGRTQPDIDLIYDCVDADGSQPLEQVVGQETEDVAYEISAALEFAGFTVKLWPVKAENYQKIIDGLKGGLIFNQVEESQLGQMVLEYLENRNLKVTGTDSRGFLLSWDKSRTKEILVQNRIPTPDYFVIKDEVVKKMPANLKFPLIVKAADDHGSLSITGKSVVNSFSGLNRQIKWIRNTLHDNVMAESYIDGRELSVTVLGNIPNLLVLPAKEILFSQKFGSIPHIVTYDSKWTEDSKDYQGSLGLACPAILDSQEKSALDRVVRQAVAALGVRDYARFDIRLKNRIPYIIDYNANPALGYDAASRIPAEISGISYPGLLSAIVRSACLRSR